ncbi:hypothetical protein SASPL_137570 [Salvia splendens]|uniref:Uncharacterized protein n=1 Tax=Salvia splendens TaxID=180675 RepID=A0A8X8WV79_SALSN|nr:hypothetical protein SASPL_137570 [Salvia splendens]
MCELQKSVAEGHAPAHIYVQDGILHFKRRISPSCGTPVALPPELLQGRPLDTPVRAVEERTMLVDGVSQVQCLVHWASDVNGAPSWESAAQPHLRLEDKSFFFGGELIGTPTRAYMSRPLKMTNQNASSCQTMVARNGSEHSQPNIS